MGSGGPPVQPRPPWPAPPPAGAAASRKPLLIALGAVAAVVVLLCSALTVVAASTFGGDESEPKWAAEHVAAGDDLAEAAEALAAAPGVRYTGWFTDDGDRVAVDAQVTTEGPRSRS